MRDLGVADLRQAESLIQLFQLIRGQLLRQEPQEVEPFLCRPLLRLELRRRSLSVQPLFGLRFHFNENIRLQLRRTSEQPWLVYPFLQRDFRRQLRVRIEQILFQMRDEIVGRDALKSESLEITFQELIE